MTTLQEAVFTVLEGFTLQSDARKILETAYYAALAPQAQPSQYGSKELQDLILANLTAPQPAQGELEKLRAPLIQWHQNMAEVCRGSDGTAYLNHHDTAALLQSAQPVAPLTVDDFEEWHKANFTQSLARRGYTYSDAAVRNRWIGWQAAHGKAPAPLTDDAIWFLWASENGLEDCNMCKLDDFKKVFQYVENACGIKGAK